MASIKGPTNGTLIMPPLASRLISSYYGWCNSYVAIGIIALALIILAAQFLKRDPRQIGQLAYGEHELGETGLDLQATGLSLREAIHIRQFWTLCIMELCFGFWLYTIMVHIVPYATGLGISATDAAIILAIIGGVSVAGRVIMGIAADRISGKSAFMVSFALMVIALFSLQLAKELWMLYLFAVVFGFGYGGESPLRPLMVAEIFGLKALGVIHGAVLVGFAIGGTIGPILAGRIFDVAGSYQLAFLVCAALGIVGLIQIFLLKPTVRQRET